MIADRMLGAHAQIDHLPMEEQQLRLDVVQEAMTWLGTPYHHQGRIKGVGVDCGMILLEVYEACGLIPHIDPRPYPPDWHLHRSEENYLKWVDQYAVQVENPLPGDLVMYRFGRCVSHGALVIEWPLVIHSYLGIGVVLGRNGEEPLGAERFDSAWSLIGGR